MGIQERRERHKEELRHQILDAAGQLFAKEGYESVSMRKIAQKIEYSPTTIYLYFKDKNELLQEICDLTFEKLVRRLLSAIDKHSDPLEALLSGSHAYIDFGVTHPDHYLSTFVVHHYHPIQENSEEFLESTGGKAFSILIDGIEKCVEAGIFREVDRLEAATSWWAMLHGATILLISEKKFPWMKNEEFLKNSFDVMVRGFSK